MGNRGLFFHLATSTWEHSGGRSFKVISGGGGLGFDGFAGLGGGGAYQLWSSAPQPSPDDGSACGRQVGEFLGQAMRTWK